MPRRDRGLASGLLGFAAIIVIVALLYTLFDPAVTDLISSVSGQTSNSEAQAVIDDREKIWDNILVYGVFLAGLFIIAKGVVEARRPG